MLKFFDLKNRITFVILCPCMCKIGCDASIRGLKQVGFQAGVLKFEEGNSFRWHFQHHFV